MLQNLALLSQFAIDFYGDRLPGSFCDVTSSLPQAEVKKWEVSEASVWWHLSMKMTEKNLRKKSVSFLPSEESQSEFLKNVIFSRHPPFKLFPVIGKLMHYLMP